MKRILAGGSAAFVLTAALISAAPPAAAGCVYGGPVLSTCDGPIQPDGTWERCVAVTRYVPQGLSSHLVPERRCGPMGPGHPAGDPPTHIPG